jgi:hypothetical protein
MNSDSFAFIQEQLTAEYKKIETDKKVVSREAFYRRCIAYVFKLIAVLGGIAVAAGIDQDMAKGIGIAIAIVICLDTVFSNHERLLCVVAAHNAYQRLLNQVHREHSRRLAPILEKKQAGNESEAKGELTRLCSELLAKLHMNAEKIEEALRAVDLKSLRIISLETAQE